jgi:hypothetical protein
MFTNLNKWLIFRSIETKICLQIDLTDYDPLLHERGFHKKLNVLVKESLQLG